MNGFMRGSRNGLLRRYLYAGSRAVRVELREQWMEAAEAWRRAAYMAPRTDWQQFARKRAEHCYRRCRGRV
ncbi:hypothetical protein MXG79_004978 [Escherichia coli]|nr:hypothetical protein [Escherichia coli]